ncbi:hypothetical protein KBY78_15090, partial [Synechococcus sp. EJ6-Ellesmere]|nr:hypothetical protein [Synechococcus sp. EJ6-Ellesmere]
MTSQATRLLDAQTVLVGWINHSATDCYEHTRSSGDVVNLGTDLDAASSFVLVASHPGHSEAVTVTLELAPLLAREGPLQVQQQRLGFKLRRLLEHGHQHGVPHIRQWISSGAP